MFVYFQSIVPSHPGTCVRATPRAVLLFSERAYRILVSVMLKSISLFTTVKCLLLALLFLTACGPQLPDAVAEAYERLPKRVDYNFHVKPILSDRCFACHGPDARNQQAELRLDTEQGAYAALTSGNGVAIKPGSLAGSEMIQRILSDDPELVMPTPESNLSLTDEEIAVLVKWVEEGAEYKAHWAFTIPKRSSIPASGEGWARNEIDRFVAAQLDLKNITPAPEAARSYLVRRVFFDLTGLPPTIIEMDRWEAATDPDWYEQLVDELLSRPTYGERMANYWMDVARFADSEGYLDDFHHAMWPYRDWVIRAYNENLPYDKFIEWQIGGDQIPNATQDQILATAFNRNHKQNSEGGIIPEEFRVEYVADRTSTVGTAFLGLTVGCARCHNHKYDPFSQENYFQLFGFFNNTVERGDAIFAYNGVENGNDVSNDMAMNAGPTLQLADSVTAKIRAHLLEMIAEQEQALADAVRQTLMTEATVNENDIRQRLTKVTVNYLRFEGDGKHDSAPGGRFKYSQMETGEGRVGSGLQVSQGVYVVDGMRSQFERSDPFTVSFWIKTPKSFDEAHVLYNANYRTQGCRGWDVVLDSNRVHLRLNHAHPFQSIDLRVDEALSVNTWTHFVWSYDGSSDATGMRVYRDGQLTNPTVMRNHLVRSTVPYTDSRATVYAPYQGLMIGARMYEQDFNGGALDEIRVLNVAAGDLLARYLYEKPIGEWSSASMTEEAVREFKLLHSSPQLAKRRENLRQLRLREVTTIDTVREVMVMGDDLNRTRPTYILERGVYDAQGKPVSPGMPKSLLEWPEGLPTNRLGLGKWLTHPGNPLTARVAVNQLWYVIFGRGIVESVEDFGNQGALPSHPELLDWLAVDFRENGWDTKRMIRLMVTSATYRQSSVIRPELKNIDPDNYLLARGPRYRRSAEMVRDNALAVSGLLEPKVGGKSVFPYQPAGLWAEANHHGFSPRYVEDEEEGLYRRSLYTFWKRNAPAPAMLVFDASLRTECQVRRQRSSTPLQALVLLNDPQILEACRVLASKELRTNNSEVDATRRIFRQLIGRLPAPNELEIITQYYEDELNYFAAHPLATQEFLSVGYHNTDLSPGAAKVAAMARVVNSVMNTTEGYYKN